MNSKKWCITAGIAAFLAIFSIAAFNMWVDPFGVFGDDWYSYNHTNNPRVSKIEYLKDNFDKYDSYIIGCSSTSSYPVEELNEYMDASFYNLIMYGADMSDVEKSVYYVANNDSDVKNIIINIYIANGISYDFEPHSLTDSLHADVAGSSKTAFYLKYAFASPEYAKAKLEAKKNDRYLCEPFDVFDVETGAYDKRKRDAEPISDLESYYSAYPEFVNYPNGYHPLFSIDENAESIGRIKSFCDERGINLIVFNAPVYYEYLNDVPKGDLERFYTAIAEKVDFWDFSSSSVSFEPRYFYDATHFRNDVGRMALARVFDQEGWYIPDDFGVLVTKDNVAQHLTTILDNSNTSSYTKKLPVLLYHHIAPKVENDMMVSPETFEAHMKAIKEAGYTALELRDIVDYIEKGIDLPEKSVLITFDDGYRSNYEYAFPILERYGLKATIFAVGETYGRLTYPGTDKAITPHFGIDEMAEMEESGVIDVQCHTFAMHQSAAHLDGIIYENVLKKDFESDAVYVDRVKNDYKKWCNAVGKEPIAVAFPHGISDIFSQELFNECGIKLTFSTVAKPSTLIKGLSQSGYALGRYTIVENTTVDRILEIISQ